MSVLSRKPGEKILIGPNITVTILEMGSNRVRLAIEAPDEVRIVRAELAPPGAPDRGAGGRSPSARLL